MTTKNQLTSSTSNVPAIPSDWEAEAVRAINDNKAGGKLLGTAEQRMQYAIMCYAAVVFLDNTTPFMLSEATTNESARKALLELVTNKFVGAIEDFDTTELGDDETADATQERGNKSTLVKAAFVNACFMSSVGITFNDFDRGAGYFRVPSVTMMPKAERGTAKLLDRLAENDSVLLDNTGAAYYGLTPSGSKKTHMIRTSMAQFKRANGPGPKPRKPRTDDANKPPAPASAPASRADAIMHASAEELSTSADLERLLQAVHILFVGDAMPDKEGDRVRARDFTPRSQTMLSAITARWTNIVAADERDANKTPARIVRKRAA